MLDNLRDQASFQPEDEPQPTNLPEPPKPPRPRRTLDQITGMTAPQRFMLAVMLLVMVCLLGIVMMVISGKVILPIG
jgi:hypothetical protein